MKKVILSIVFVFASLAFVNANASINSLEINLPSEDEYEECHELYNTVRDAVFAATGDFHYAVTAAIAAEEVCTDEVDNL